MFAISVCTCAFHLRAGVAPYKLTIIEEKEMHVVLSVSLSLHILILIKLIGGSVAQILIMHSSLAYTGDEPDYAWTLCIVLITVYGVQLNLIAIE